MKLRMIGKTFICTYENFEGIGPTMLTAVRDLERNILNSTGKVVSLWK